MVLHENICQGLSILNSGGGRGYSQNHHNDRVKFYAKIVWLKQWREENSHDVWKKTLNDMAENTFTFATFGSFGWKPISMFTIQIRGDLWPQADSWPEDTHWLSLREESQPQKVIAERTGWNPIHGKLTGRKQCDGKRCNKRQPWMQPGGNWRARVIWENGEN